MIEYRDFTVDELISYIRRGADADAFDTESEADDACAELMRRYAPMINSAVADAMSKISAFSSENQSGAGADEDELRQEAAIKLYRAAMTYNGKSDEVSFGLYAKICVRRRLSSIVSRKCGEEIMLRIDDEDGAAEFARDDDPSAALIEKEREGELDEQIRRAMSPLEYEVYKLCLDGADTEAIEKNLSLSKRSAENALYRMRSKLKGIIGSGRSQ